MDCIVTAGGVPQPDSPLYTETQGQPKALLQINGRPMGEIVINTLLASAHVDDVVVVGLGHDYGMQLSRPVDHLPSQGGLIDNLLAGFAHFKQKGKPAAHILICSTDVPLISIEMIDDLVTRCQPLDKKLYYTFVTKETVEKRFPGSGRTFVKLKGMEIAGADVIVSHSSLADHHHELYKSVRHARKHAWQLARVVGFGFLLRFLLRQVSIPEIEATVTRILEEPAQIIMTPYAELGMDVDKLEQLARVRVEMEGVTG